MLLLKSSRLIIVPIKVVLGRGNITVEPHRSFLKTLVIILLDNINKKQPETTLVIGLNILTKNVTHSSHGIIYPGSE